MDEQNKSARHPKCLILLPFDAAVNRLRDTVQRALRKSKVEPIFFESELPAGARRVDQLFGLLRSADFVIVDISRKNPNVLFELGVAHGLGKPFVLLLSSESDTASIPSDLMGYQFLPYEPADLSAFADRLDRVVASVASRLELGK